MRYTKEQISTALLLLKATGSPNKVIKTLGYPSSPMLYHWRDMYPEYYDDPDQKHWKQTPNELKQCIIKRCILGGESVKLVAEEVGYTPSLIYKWIREYGKKGHFLSMKKAATNVEVNPSDIESAEDINALKAQMFDTQMEIDILKETINVLKKDPGIDQTTLANREKAVIIDALKNKYALPSLCKKPDLAKSSYYYQEKAIHAKDKYLELRKKIVQLFHDNRNVFGYRKIHTLLRMAGIIVSEKVVRRIMKQESLIVKQRHRQMYIPLKTLFSRHKRLGVQFTDEPTGNLDRNTSEDVIGLLKMTSKEFHQTIVMITHNPEIAQMADQVIQIEDGKIVA